MSYPHAESIASSSRSSLASSESISTNATASDLAGPGRLIGKAYLKAGRVLEKGIGAITARKHRRRTKHSTGTSWQDLPSARSSMDGSESIVETVISNRTSAILSFNTRFNFSRLTLSTNETASNRPGAGRLLGRLYDIGGQKLESNLNFVATRAGRGPDARFNKILSMLSENGLTAEALRIDAAAHRNAQQILSLIIEKKKLETECKRLLKYARSHVPSTRRRALLHITALVVEDPYLQTLFNALGASQILENLRARELRYLATDSYIFVPHCRKALICLSVNEVNVIAKRYHQKEDGTGTDLMLALWKYISDPEQSFLVLRHLRRILVMHSPRMKLLFGLQSELMGKLADLIFSLPHIIEWTCLDDICIFSLEAYLTHTEYGAVKEYTNTLHWRKFIQAMLRNSHQLPKTVEYLTTRANMSYVFNPDNRNPISASGTFKAFPDGKYLDSRLFHSISLFPQIIFDIHDEDVSESSLVIRVRRPETLSPLSVTYSQQSLVPLWEHLSIQPDALVTQILTEEYSSVCRTEFLDRVPRAEVLAPICTALASCLTSSDVDSKARAAQRVKFVLQLDRYCNRQMMEALVNLVHPLPPDENIAALTRSPLLTKPTLDDRLRNGDFYNWVYRHRTVDGGHTHIHKKLKERFSRNFPCRLCVAKGTWDDDQIPATEVFRAADRQVMLHEVPPGTAFTTSGHIPVIAGVTDAGEKEYLACTQVIRQYEYETMAPVVEWTCVKNGATNVTYFDDGVKTSDHFWVLVLRFDTSHDVEEAKRAEGGMDITGECQWLET